MKNFNWFLLSLLFIFVITSCNYYKSDFNLIKVQSRINEISIITTEAEIKRYNDKDWVDIEIRGTSFSIGDGYQLALVHATIIKEDYLIQTPFGAHIPDHRKVRNQKHYIDDKEIELIGMIDDIVLFKKPWASLYPYKIGQDPMIGDNLLMIGNSMLNGVNIKIGLVSLMSMGRYTIESDDFKYCFVHTVPTNGGDSGSPLLAMNRNFEYEVVGIVNASTHKAQEYSFAIKASRIHEVIEEIKGKSNE